MTDASTVSDAPPAEKRRSYGAEIWRRFRRHTGGVAGLAVFAAIVLGVSIGPHLYGISPDAMNYLDKNQGASWAHWMGTDNLGHDLFAQVLAGGQISVAVGFTAMLLSLILGTFIGLMAGYFRAIDGFLMRLTDLFLALPLLPLLLVVIMLFRDTLRAALGPETGIFILIVFVIGITSWMHTARIVRGDVLTLKDREFVLSARSGGVSDRHIILRHLLPNVVSSILVSATLGIATAIITESALSFLGLGFPSDFPTWGRLLYDGVNFMEITPSRVIWPGLAISLTVLSVNYIGDGLRDAFDPRGNRK